MREGWYRTQPSSTLETAPVVTGLSAVADVSAAVDVSAVVEAQDYISYEEGLVGMDLVVGKRLDFGLTPASRSVQ